jgi:hypothetical protein
MIYQRRKALWRALIVPQGRAQHQPHSGSASRKYADSGPMFSNIALNPPGNHAPSSGT